MDGFLNVTSLDAETSRRKTTIHETMGGVSYLDSGEWEGWGGRLKEILMWTVEREACCGI